MPKPALRRAEVADLDGIVALETACFEPERRASRSSLRRSLLSPRQAVWVLADGAAIVGSLVLWHHPLTTRIYGVAVDPACQGQGLGEVLMQHAEQEAMQAGARHVTLEADEGRARLVGWYERLGYRRVRLREDFYAPGRGAWRMEKSLP